MKPRLLIYLAICAFFGAACKDDLNPVYPTYEKSTDRVYEGYELAWSEEFDKSGLPDPTYWNAQDWGGVINNEPQDYRKDDLKYTRVEDGKLILETHKDPHEGTIGWGSDEPYHFEYSSGEIHTKGKYAFQYGRIDIAAKLPIGCGAWPAFWLMPTKNLYGKYAEIDIMEFMWGYNNAGKYITGTLHTQASRDGVHDPIHGFGYSGTLESNYHLYSLIWEKEKIEILFDDQVICTYEKEKDMDWDNWPFDQPFFLILNIAVGPSWSGFDVDESIFPLRMEVDYIRYYKPIEKGDDDTEKPDEPEEVVNLFENGDFEGQFSNGDPGVDVDGTNPISNSGNLFMEGYLNRWLGHGGILTVNHNGGAENTNSCLKHTFVTSGNPWENNIIYAPGKIKAGKYKFSFYVKANKETALQNIITIFENSVDLAKENHAMKVLQCNTDGKWSIDPSLGYMPKGLVPGHTITTEWQKIEYTIDIPANALMTFSFRPCYSGDWAKHTNCTDMEFYYDEFLLTESDGSEPEEPTGPSYSDNYFDNGDLESKFTNGDPAIDSEIGGNNAVNLTGDELIEKYLNRWLGHTTTLEVDFNGGAEGTSGCLKQTFKSTEQPYDNNVLYTPGQLESGQYIFSFYVKANKETALQNIITIFENSEDLSKRNHAMKVLQCNTDGKWSIDPSLGYMPKGLVPGHTITTEWQKIEYTIDIPANALMTFSFRPCYSGDWAKHTNCTDMEFYYDEFSLVKIVE